MLLFWKALDDRGLESSEIANIAMYSLSRAFIAVEKCLNRGQEAVYERTGGYCPSWSVVSLRL